MQMTAHFSKIFWKNDLSIQTAVRIWLRTVLVLFSLGPPNGSWPASQSYWNPKSPSHDRFCWMSSSACSWLFEIFLTDNFREINFWFWSSHHTCRHNWWVCRSLGREWLWFCFLHKSYPHSIDKLRNYPSRQETERQPYCHFAWADSVLFWYYKSL